MEKILLDMVKFKELLISEFVLIVVWITYIIKLNILNDVLKKYYLSSDDIFVRAFKIVFSEQYKSILIYLIVGIVLLLALIGITCYLFMRVNNTLSIVLGILNIILIVLVLTSLLAPILISIAIVFAIIGGVIWASSNS